MHSHLAQSTTVVLVSKTTVVQPHRATSTTTRLSLAAVQLLTQVFEFRSTHSILSEVKRMQHEKHQCYPCYNKYQSEEIHYFSSVLYFKVKGTSAAVTVEAPHIPLVTLKGKNTVCFLYLVKKYSNSSFIYIYEKNKVTSDKIFRLPGSPLART